MSHLRAAPTRGCIAQVKAEASMRSILISFVLLFWAWQPASAEDAKQLTTPNRENLGVKISQIKDETAKILGVQPPRGAIVHYVIEKSPASRAGIVPGDVIVTLNGIDIHEVQDVQRVIDDIPTGKTVPIIVIRFGREIIATATFDTIVRVRSPTCDELFSYAKFMPTDAIDRSFGKRNGDLSANDFDDALAIVFRCGEAVAPPVLGTRGSVPVERNGQFQLNVLSILAQQLKSRKSEAVRREGVLVSRSEVELNARFAERKNQIDVQIKAEQAAADAQTKAKPEAAKAEECRLQCRQRLTAMLTELRSLGTDQASNQRLRELAREQRDLFASMPMDVQTSLKPLRETFVSEYGEHETAAQNAEAKISEAKLKADAKINETQLHVAEMAKHEEELKAIYSTYLILDFCAKRFPNFSEGKDTARDVAKNKEATQQLYSECSGASNTLMALIMSGVAEPSEGRLRKKDF
jgi:PDZ domain